MGEARGHVQRVIELQPAGVRRDASERGMAVVEPGDRAGEARAGRGRDGEVEVAVARRAIAVGQADERDIAALVLTVATGAVGHAVGAGDGVVGLAVIAHVARPASAVAVVGDDRRGAAGEPALEARAGAVARVAPRLPRRVRDRERPVRDARAARVAIDESPRHPGRDGAERQGASASRRVMNRSRDAR